MPKLGAHMSIAGGIWLAFDRLEKAGGEAMQIFTGNLRQWKTAPLLPEAVALFRERTDQAALVY